MADPNGWPDASKPGVPLNPERFGWHWLAWDKAWPEPAYWDGQWSQPDKSNLSVRTAVYIGPLLSRAEVAARVAEARAMTDAWQPISSAPEDDWCLIATKDGTVGEAMMARDEETNEQVWNWAGFIPVHANHKPTHWQPLPPPPKENSNAR